MPVRFYADGGTMVIDHEGGNIRNITDGSVTYTRIADYFYVRSIIEGIEDIVINNFLFSDIQNQIGAPLANADSTEIYIQGEIQNWKDNGGGGGSTGPGSNTREFLGNVDFITDASLLTPQDGDYVHNNETGTIFSYSGGLWSNTFELFSRTPNRAPILTLPPVTISGAFTLLGDRYQALADNSVLQVAQLTVNGNGVSFDLSTVTESSRIYVGEWTGAQNNTVENDENWRFAIEGRRQGANYRWQDLKNTNIPSVPTQPPSAVITLVRINQSQVQIQVGGVPVGETISGTSAVIPISLAVRNINEELPSSYVSL